MNLKRFVIAIVLSFLALVSICGELTESIELVEARWVLVGQSIYMGLVNTTQPVHV